MNTLYIKSKKFADYLLTCQDQSLSTRRWATSTTIVMDRPTCSRNKVVTNQVIVRDKRFWIISMTNLLPRIVHYTCV